MNRDWCGIVCHRHHHNHHHHRHHRCKHIRIEEVSKTESVPVLLFKIYINLLLCGVWYGVSCSVCVSIRLCVIGIKYENCKMGLNLENGEYIEHQELNDKKRDEEQLRVFFYCYSE